VSTAFAGTDRFELVRRLGEGGFGTVYEAFDRQRSARVALKLLREAEGTALYRFKREFRALADISHPNLVALDELLTDGWHWFFTMELVRGIPLVAYARPAAEPNGGAGKTTRLVPKRLDEPRLRFALSQLANALHTIHRAGIVHCDIKPSNVLVTAEGRVVVLDFGLVAERPAAAASDPSLRSSFENFVVVGTPAYMAPEQATAERITPAADWYSVGVMLYQILTGQLPFSGSTFEVLEAKRDSSPRAPTDLNRDAPKDLAVLAMKLLNPDPARRPSGEAVLRCVNRTTTHAPVETSSAPVPEVLLGRESHLKRLAEAFEMAMRGEPVVAFVSGLSGMGKTALIRRFLQEQQNREPELLVLRSRCYERESVPYKAVDPLVDAIAHHLQRLRDIEVARLLPRDAAILARLFPVLLGVEEVRRAPQHPLDSIDSVTLRQRAAAALRDLLFGLAVRAPLMLVIDDLQWGDIDSASILQEVLRPPEAPPLLLVVAYRSEDAEARLLRDLSKSIREASQPKVYDIEVGALSDGDARQLAIILTAGVQDGAERADAIARESGGNAFFVHELAQHSTTVGGRTTLDAVVRDRVSALPEGARRLLTAIALSAQSIPADVAVAAAEVDAQDRELLQLLRTLRLIRGRPHEPHIETYHDRIREAIVGQLENADLPGWHDRLATAWERSGMARPETLVVHFEAGGDGAKASEYAVAAAEIAQEALAFDRAAEFYGLIVRHEPDDEKRRQWLVKLGHALANAGRGHEASSAFLAALNGASPDEVIELERLAATQLIRSGYHDEAADVIERLLRKVGVRPLGTNQQALLSLLGYRLLLAIRGTKFRERRESEIAPATLRRIDVLTSISAPLSLSSYMQGYALTAQMTWHALRAGEPRRVVAALTGLAAGTSVWGSSTERRAHDLVKQAEGLAVRLQDPWTTGRTVLAEGIVLKLNGHWKRGAERLSQANEILAGCTGVRWEIETSQMLRHDALYWMGEWGRLAREMPARRQEAEQRGDLYSATHVSARLSPLMHLAADRVDLARTEAENGLAQWTTRHFHLQHRFGVCTAVDIELYSGNPENASRRLEDAWPDLKGMLFVIQHHRIEMVFYRARVALALAAKGDQAALRRAESDARRLDGERAPWARALARLIKGGVAQARGRTKAATSELEAAEVELRRCDMNLYAAAAQCRRGNLIGGSAGQALVDAAFQSMSDQQVLNPARLVNLLAPGPW
jgi:hypothetical protein